MSTQEPKTTPLTGPEMARLLTLLEKNPGFLLPMEKILEEVKPMNWEIPDDKGF